MTDKSTEWALMWAKVETRIAKQTEPSPADVQRRITEVAKFDRGFLHAMGISLVLVLALLVPFPAHARKRNKIIAIGAAVGGAIVAGALASTGNQSQPPTTRQVTAHHGMRH